MLEEGFKKKSEEMKGEIQRLNSIVDDMKKNSGSFIGRILLEFATLIAAPILVPVMVVKSIVSAFK